jgi:hypothetical protein
LKKIYLEGDALSKVPLLPPVGRAGVTVPVKHASGDTPKTFGSVTAGTSASSVDSVSVGKAAASPKLTVDGKQKSTASPKQSVGKATNSVDCAKLVPGKVAASSKQAVDSAKQKATAAPKQKAASSVDGAKPAPAPLAKKDSSTGVLNKGFGGEVKVKRKFQRHGDSSSRPHHNGNVSEKLSTSYSIGKATQYIPDRRRADSGQTRVASPVKSSRIPPVQPIPYSKRAELLPTKTTPTHTPKKPKSIGTGYENVHPSPSQPKPHPLHSPPMPLSPESLDYENLSFNNRDSEVYENIGIGFAGSGDMAGPLPPLPMTKSPSMPVQQSYENVQLGKSPGGSRAKEEVMEDDDTLFGKEGPPGMQEMIYENFGPDKGNVLMSIEELAAHVESLGKKGLSTEYYKVRNEPVTGQHKACR